MRDFRVMAAPLLARRVASGLVTTRVATSSDGAAALIFNSQWDIPEIIRGSFDQLDAPASLVAGANTPVPFAPALEAVHLPTVDKLVAAIRELLAS